VERASEKQNITLMFSVFANGNIVPPMIVLPYQRIPVDILRYVPIQIGELRDLTMDG
jgi:hypothetical protein